MTRTPVGGLALIALLASTSAMAQTDSRPKPQQVPAVKPADPLASVPSLSGLVARTTSEMAGVLERFTADQQSLNRRYDAPDSPEQRTRFRAFYGAWRARLKEVDFEKLKQEGRVDYVLLDHYLQHQQALLDRADKQRTETAPLLPFADALLTLQDTRRTMASVDGKADAHTLAQITKEVDSLRTLLDAPAGRGGAQGGAADAPRAAAPKASRTIANRAADNLDQIRSTITGWYRYYDGYDPLFSWWAKDPYTKLDDALTRYSRSIRDRLVGGAAAAGSQIAAGGGRGAAPATGGGGRGGGAGGAGGGGGGGGRGGTDNSGPIIGDPIGMDGLMADLQYEMIPYTPDELIAIAEKEYAFSLSEMKKASREMGFGDDWKKAMDKVKDTYVDPGKQPDLIRDLGRQAEEFFDAHDWVTIPALAKEDWRMEMMTPDRQRVAPFFLGGEMIQVSYPTADMTDDEKLMSLRGNNPHFSHATVFHELNPGHHLQQFMQARYNQQRRIFTTPFWSEGQSLYWEMFLWDHGFQVSPEDRVGALFWRMHRSARIIFSLNFHLGKMTPDQAIQFLVDTVNFERANAEGEVRRSFNGTYSPLYQAGYMLGGLEIRALHKELVDGKKMTDREFHDAILQGGPMPIAMVRARLANTPLTRDGPGPWKFADLLPPPIPAPIKR